MIDISEHISGFWLSEFRHYLSAIHRTGGILAHLKTQVKKHIQKIIDNPEIGKPMRYNRKGTREIYIQQFRLSYAYIKEEDKIIFLDLYHKDEQ